MTFNLNNISISTKITFLLLIGALFFVGFQNCTSTEQEASSCSNIQIPNDSKIIQFVKQFVQSRDGQYSLIFTYSESSQGTITTVDVVDERISFGNPKQCSGNSDTNQYVKSALILDANRTKSLKDNLASLNYCGPSFKRDIIEHLSAKNELISGKWTVSMANPYSDTVSGKWDELEKTFDDLVNECRNK